jgi:soluble lytic murein transglycosylase
MVDWIELIPNAETRNYVQRVIENLAIYRARRGDNAAHPLAQWLH